MKRRVQDRIAAALRESASPRIPPWFAIITAPLGAAVILVVFNNIALLLGVDAEFKVAVLIVLLLAITSVTFLWILVERKTIRLRRNWNALAWHHYRPVLVQLAARSRPIGSFDFVTASGAQLRQMITGGLQPEFRYRIGEADGYKLVVFDIEMIASQRSPSLGTAPGADDDLQLVPLTALVTESTLANSQRGLPSQLLTALTNPGHASPDALALQWGFGSIGLKVGSRTRELLVDLASCDIDDPQFAFDLAWLTQDTILRQRIRDSAGSLRVLVHDWHLPILMLLSDALVGETAWNQPDPAEIALVAESLEQLVPLVSEDSFVEDVLALRHRLEAAEEAIVLGGGNWLWTRSGRLEGVKCVPYLGKDLQPRCILWCECFGILTPNGRPPVDAEWRADGKRLTAEFVAMVDNWRERFPFHSFPDHDVTERDSHITEWLTRADQIGRVRTVPQSDDKWQSEWQTWQDRITTT